MYKRQVQHENAWCIVVVVICEYYGVLANNSAPQVDELHTCSAKNNVDTII